MKNITSFTNENFYLSNFYKHEIIILGEKFPTVEHAYQSFKTTTIEDFKKIQQANSPSLARKLGRKVPIKNNWEFIKFRIMKHCVRIKFYTSKELSEKLLLTKEYIIEEGNNHGDTEWGTVQGKGKNLLGIILMQVREELTLLKSSLPVTINNFF